MEDLRSISQISPLQGSWISYGKSSREIIRARKDRWLQGASIVQRAQELTETMAARTGPALGTGTLRVLMREREIVSTGE